MLTYIAYTHQMEQTTTNTVYHESFEAEKFHEKFKMTLFKYVFYEKVCGIPRNFFREGLRV